MNIPKTRPQRLAPPAGFADAVGLDDSSFGSPPPHVIGPPPVFNKTQMVEAIVSETSLTKAQAREVLHSILEVVVETEGQGPAFRQIHQIGAIRLARARDRDSYALND